MNRGRGQLKREEANIINFLLQKGALITGGGGGLLENSQYIAGKRVSKQWTS